MFTNLSAKNAILRPLTMADAQDLATYANNRKIWLQLRNFFPQPYWVMDAIRFLEQVELQKPRMTYAIEVNGRCAGVISGERLRDIYKETIVLGYWLGEPFWGQGIATAVVSAFSHQLLDLHDVQRLEAGVFSTNKASMRVLEKAGFHEEAIHHNKVRKAGALLHEHLFVKLKA